jgi:FAD-linked oxidoreductase
MTATRADFRWSNWSGTVRGNPVGVIHPSTVAQIVDVITDERLRAGGFSTVGSGHSYVPLASPSGRTLIDLRHFTGIVAEDRDRSTVTVGAGTTIRELNEALAARGLALPNQSAIDAQTVAGALATATHGSSRRLGSLSSHVAGLRFVASDGEVREVGSGDTDLDAWRVHLGCLGVVTEITLDVVPAFALRRSVCRQPLRQVLADLDRLLNAEFAGFWWYPHTSVAMVWRADLTPSVQSGDSRRTAVLPARLIAAASRRPRAIAGTVNALAAWLACRRPTGGAFRSDAALVTGLPPRQQSLECSVPIESTADAIDALRRTLRDRGLKVTAPIDVRFTAADTAWLSPAHGRETCHIGLSAYLPRAGGSEWKSTFGVLDALLASYGGRPHWAKVHFRRPDQLAQSYPRWTDFHRVRQRLDPDQVFLTDYLRSLFGERDRRSR